MRTLAVRPGLQFAALAALLATVESAALVSRGFARHPEVFRLAAIVDLCVILPAAFWLLLVRRKLFRPRAVARVALVAIAACALLFGRDVRLLAAPLELALIWLAVRSVRKALQARTAPDAATALRLGLCEALGDNPAARAAAAELSVLWYALFSWGQEPPAGFTAYRRGGWIALYGAVAMTVLAEGIPLHFLLPRGWALASAVLHGYTLLWLLGDLRAMMLRPITVLGGVLRLRIGLKWEADLPLGEIASAQLGSAAVGRKLGVLGAPNLVLRMHRPVELRGLFGIRLAADTVSLQVDDPAALARAISEST